MAQKITDNGGSSQVNQRAEGAVEPPIKPDLRLIPEPWRYNPSKWSQRVRISVIAAVAFFIASYMSLYQWQLIEDVWDPVFGEGSRNVLDSDVSHTMRSWFRIPDAALGALAYLGDIIFAMAGSTRRWQFRPWLVLVFGVDVLPLGIVSAILVALQGTVVGSWCFLCLVTAFISLLLAALAFDEVWSSILYLARVWRRERDIRLLWKTLWGQPSQAAHEVALEMARRRSNVG